MLGKDGQDFLSGWSATDERAAHTGALRYTDFHVQQLALNCYEYAESYHVVNGHEGEFENCESAACRQTSDILSHFKD